MQINDLSIQSLDIPFKVSFSHASADRSRTQSVLVTAVTKQGFTGYGEGCPREYVTGESLESVMAFFEAQQQDASRLTDVTAIQDWVNAHRSLIDANPAAWCAMELALLDVLGKSTGKSLESLLHQPELYGEFQYSAILGTDNPQVFAKLLAMYLDMGITDFKVKLMGDLMRDQEKIALLNKHVDKNLRIRFDANNCWADARTASHYLSSLDCPFWAVEEPLSVGQYTELVRLAEYLGTRVILDESFLRLDQCQVLEDNVDIWLVNIRVSKMGGLLRSLELIERCHALGIPVIVGAQVGETSILTRAALTIAQRAGDLLMAQEGAYGTYLLQHDICEPSLMFGRGGKLQNVALALQPDCGFGLVVKD